jgi:1,4-dihydroxy-6-naphthoate synthase
MKITLAHSPDADDAFMFYALAKDKIDTRGYQFEHILSDIQTLNKAAIDKQLYDISAVSFHAFPYMQNSYELMDAGASMGDNYGPIIVCKSNEDTLALKKGIKSGEVTVAVPGELTSAYLALKLYAPNVNVVFEPFDKILENIESGKVKAGLIIHEGQISYKNEGFQAIKDLGVWWFERTNGLPLPLGANVVRKSFAQEVKIELNEILRESIAYSLNHREDAVNYALTFARGLEKNDADRFIGMYVNDLTLELGQRGKQSVNLFLKEAFNLGFLDVPQLESIYA